MSRLTAESQRRVYNFNPEFRDTMLSQELRQLLLKTPIPAFWKGRTYRIKHKSLGVGVHEVWGDFEP